MNKKYLLGIDNGTTTTKATLFDFEGASEYSAINQRMDQWENAYRIFLENPFGLGTGRLGLAQSRLQKFDDTSYNVEIADGNYFKIIAENGLQGIIAYVLFTILLMKYLSRTIKHTRNPQIKSNNLYGHPV